MVEIKSLHHIRRAHRGYVVSETIWGSELLSALEWDVPTMAAARRLISERTSVLRERVAEVRGYSIH